MSFAAAYRQIMQDFGLTASKVSDISGVSGPYISQVFTSKIREPAWSKAVPLVAALDLDVETFLFLQKACEDGTYTKELALACRTSARTFGRAKKVSKVRVSLAPQAGELSGQERKTLESYRKLNSVGQKRAEELLAVMVDSGHYKVVGSSDKA